MIIAVDLTSFGKEFRGGKEQVVCNLLLGFSQISPLTKLRLFCYEDYAEKAGKLAPGAELVIFKRRKISKFVQDMYVRTFLLKKHLKNADVLFFPIYYTGFAAFSIPTVVLPHDIQFKSCPTNFDAFTRFKESVLYYLDFWLRDHIIAISDFDYNETAKYYPQFTEKIKKIYNPIHFSEIKSKSERKHFLAINIGFAHKNTDTLIRAYALIKDKVDKPLLLVGKAYDDIKIDELITELGLEDKVRHLGYVPNDELGQLIVDSYAYITPSTYEGFGMTAVEAILYRVPVISSKQEALYEVTFGSALYYEPYKDEEALAEKILELMGSYPNEEHLSDMREKALSMFHYKKISKEYLKFFNRISSCVLYADPMSYHNLALYDYNLISNMSDVNVIFAGNNYYNLDEDFNLHRIYNYSKYPNNILKMLSYTRSQRMLRRLVKKHHVKVLHLQWSRMAGFDSLLIKRMKKKFGIKFVYTSHDTFSHNFEEKKKKSFLKLMKTADGIIVHTDKSKGILESYGFTNTEVINHGLLDIRTLYPPEPVEFNGEGKIVFSLLGYMEAYKGTDILLKAWLSSKKLLSMKHMQLVVIGKNKMDFVPDIPVESNVIFEDTLLNDYAFTRWMELSDVVVLPYQSISQSGLMLTALSMNKHFIVNDVGEIAKPVEKYNLGWVINEKTSEGLRLQLEKIAAEIAESGLQALDDDLASRINTDYSWVTSGLKTSEMYKDLINNSKNL